MLERLVASINHDGLLGRTRYGFPFFDGFTIVRLECHAGLDFKGDLVESLINQYIDLTPVSIPPKVEVIFFPSIELVFQEFADDKAFKNKPAHGVQVQLRRVLDR